MNAQRRKQIAEITAHLEEFKAVIDALMMPNSKGNIETIRDEEQEAFDNLSEGLQASDNGQLMESAIENLSAAEEGCDEISQMIENLSDKIVDVMTMLSDAQSG
jgi:hypothetical protein